MGLCMSSGATVAAVRAEGQTASTAMVLLPTGELREYPPAATAARVLEEVVEAGGGWLLCDADAMEFEGAVSAVGGAEELRPGQIYFVLPAEARRNGLRREDIASLAVRASAALVKKASSACGSGRRRRAGSVSPLVFAPPAEKVDQTAAYKTVPALAAKRRPVARVKSAGKMQPRFAPDLSAIPECDTISIMEALRPFWRKDVDGAELMSPGWPGLHQRLIRRRAVRSVSDGRRRLGAEDIITSVQMWLMGVT